jgi:large subunit ribosomal protein L23
VDKAISLYDVIKRPLVTEKSTVLSGVSKYIFEVDPRANKPLIKKAVEEAFKVRVAGVNVMVVKGKPRSGRMRRKRITYASDWKKAIVTLVGDDKIELFEGV